MESNSVTAMINEVGLNITPPPTLPLHVIHFKLLANHHHNHHHNHSNNYDEEICDHNEYVIDDLRIDLVKHCLSFNFLK